MFSTIPAHFKFKHPHFLNYSLPVQGFSDRRFIQHEHPRALHYRLSSRARSCKICLWARACGDGSQAESFAVENKSAASDVEALRDDLSSSNEGYVALFIRMLGLDNDPLDREQAVVALWKYSLGGKQCIDNVMKYHGIVNLVVNLLKSNSDSACEAAAGLLRVISAINLYRDLVAGSGAIEEITSLLMRSSLSSDVKEQAICSLWNLSVDEKLRILIAKSEILPLLIKSLEDEHMNVKEAAVGVLANLTLSQSNHRIMVEAGVIPKLAKLLTTNLEEYLVIKKAARNALLELAKDDYNRILLLEEGLVVVPLIGEEAYKSFRPALYSWPSLPDGTEIEQRYKGPSKYGASELLIGLNIENKNADLEESKINAVVGRTQQQFLARVGAIEIEDGNTSNGQWPSNHTLLPWMDAVARLVLILGLKDESAIARAAGSIADASINEHMRVAFQEAGAIKNLVQLINHPSGTVKLAVIQTLDKLSISNSVCQRIEAEGVAYDLVHVLKQSTTMISRNLKASILNILSRIMDPNKEMKSKFDDAPFEGSKKGWEVPRHPVSADGSEANNELPVRMQPVAGGNLFCSTFLSCLVNIMKTDSPDLQRKASSILEFILETEPSVEKLISAKIESGLEAVFQQRSIIEPHYGDAADEKEEVRILELEEAGFAISAAARLLTKLLDHEEVREVVNSRHLMKLLHAILVSNIPLQCKEWVAACLVKLSSLSRDNSNDKDSVNIEVTLYETIPRLIEQIKSSSTQVQEAAVLELNRIISEGLVDSSSAVASGGGIFPLVKLMGNGSEQAVEASLAILYNLSIDSENHAAIIAAGAVPVLRKIVLSQRPQWMRALRLLRTLPV